MHRPVSFAQALSGAQCMSDMLSKHQKYVGSDADAKPMVYTLAASPSVMHAAAFAAMLCSHAAMSQSAGCT